jgi:competence protein ComEA
MNKWWIASFIVIGTLVGVGILFLVTQPPRGEPIKLLPAPTPAPLLVYVSGEVNQPGLYTLSPGSRINEAIQSAGGFTENADSSRINLAAIVQDGEQIAARVDHSR